MCWWFTALSLTSPEASASTLLSIKNQRGQISGPLRGFPSCVRACVRPRAVPCLYDGLWSSEGTYCTRPGLLEMLCLHLLPIGRETARTHAFQWPRRSASLQGRPTALTSPRRPFSLPHNATDWDGFSKHFHTRKHTPTRAYTLGFYRRDPPRSTVIIWKRRIRKKKSWLNRWNCWKPRCFFSKPF